MRFELSSVPVQSGLIVDKLLQNELIEIIPSMRGKLCKSVERILENYIKTFAVLEDQALRFLVDNQLDEDNFRRRVLKNLAKEGNFPIFGEALDYLNLQIEELLLEHEAVEEVFAESRQLVAAITPHLKTMIVKTPRN